MSSSTDTAAFVERVVPARQPPTSGLPPLVVMLHGIGADEHDLVGLAPALDPRVTVVSLRAPRAYHTGFSWFDIDFRPGGQIVPNLDQARASLRDLVAYLGGAAARHRTYPRRVFLLGFSQGAMMSLGVLHTQPSLLAGVVALSGRFPGETFGTPAGSMRDIPVFVGHGTYDDVLAIDNGRKVRDALTPQVNDLTYREYPVGHGISDAEMQDIAAWLTRHLGN
jgi:phospholipase/carboxylesterase